MVPWIRTIWNKWDTNDRVGLDKRTILIKDKWMGCKYLGFYIFRDSKLLWRHPVFILSMNDVWYNISWQVRRIISYRWHPTHKSIYEAKQGESLQVSTRCLHLPLVHKEGDRPWRGLLSAPIVILESTLWLLAQLQLYKPQMILFGKQL